MSKTKLAGRLHRKSRIRKKIAGTSERPRLTIFRSLKHIYAQVIDDIAGKTLLSVSTLEKGQEKGKRNKTQAQVLGKKLAERAKSQNIETVVFDRNGYLYHGCVQAFADGVREGGLKF